MVSFRRRQMLAAAVSGGGGGYIVFADPEVEAICVQNWGDGVGITYAQAAAVTSQQLGTTFQGNTQITSFDELEYFTGLTSIPEEAFLGCSSLASVKIPTSVTYIGWGAFADCTSLSGTIIVPSTVTQVERAAFANTPGLTNIVSYMSTTTDLFRANSYKNSGNGTGIFYMLNGSFSGESHADFKDILVDGNISYDSLDSMFSSSAIETFRVRGTATAGASCEAMIAPGSPGLKFLELLGQYSGIIMSSSWYWGTYRSGAIAHLGYAGVAGTPGGISASVAELTKIYVGTGESQAADQAVLNQYLADAAWSAYSSKLDLWYNYNGEYKTWPTIPTT